MNRLIVKSQVGPDGVLQVTVPLGAANANREVRIIIEPLPPRLTQEDWQNFIMSTAGTWQGDFERPEQGEYEQREKLP